ncbi:MAG TPA: PAS domain-containing sensor histidine kinase [Planctomycetota bacterium]|nr:PAS domain-containing sensor histidine kinase [Planctomycetota bacterium]
MESAGRDTRQMVAALAEETQRLGAAIACMSEGLVILDRDYRFATLNPAARDMLGVEDLAELARKLGAREADPSIHPVFWLASHDESAKPQRCWLARECGRSDCPAHGGGLFPCWLYDGTLCHGGEPAGTFPAKLDACYLCSVYQANARLADPAASRGRREIALARPVKRVLMSLSSPIVDAEGRFLGAVKVLHDVTAERMMAQKRVEFASFVTHELRTPLTSIGGFLALVLGGRAGELSDAQRRHLDTALAQARRLEKLVDTLLDMAAIEAGRFRLHLGRFDLTSVVTECADLLRPQADGKGVALRVLLPDEPLVVTADRDRVGEVLTNLTANAIKYTGSGGTVEVAARANSDGFVVEVADTGIGIPPDDVPHLFDRFYRTSSGAARAKGSGLGLAICKGIIEGHGGRVGVESTPGMGSRFFFTLPRNPQPTVAWS